MSSIFHKSPKTMYVNILILMPRRHCTIVENNSIKNKHLNDLKTNFKIYSYPEKIVEIGKQKPLKNPANNTLTIQSH